MTAAKDKKKDHAQLVVPRTEPIESLLQKLWGLRPEYKEKFSLTIYCAIAALIREAECVDRSAHLTKIPAQLAEVGQRSEPVGVAILNPDSEWN